jgi:HPt (histidine-containing phosphotransfer) domain-containing protein
LREHASIRDSFLAELVSIFEEDAPASLRQIRSLCEAGKLKEAGDSAHGLKGSAASLGLSRLAASAMKIQKAGRAGDSAALPKLLDEMDGLLQPTLAELKKLSAAVCEEARAQQKA